MLTRKENQREREKGKFTIAYNRCNKMYTYLVVVRCNKSVDVTILRGNDAEDSHGHPGGDENQEVQTVSCSAFLIVLEHNRDTVDLLHLLLITANTANHVYILITKL